jgi:hypothetical protein
MMQMIDTIKGDHYGRATLRRLASLHTTERISKSIQHMGKLGTTTGIEDKRKKRQDDSSDEDDRDPNRDMVKQLKQSIIYFPEETMREKVPSPRESPRSKDSFVPFYALKEVNTTLSTLFPKQTGFQKRQQVSNPMKTLRQILEHNKAQKREYNRTLHAKQSEMLSKSMSPSRRNQQGKSMEMPQIRSRLWQDGHPPNAQLSSLGTIKLMQSLAHLHEERDQGNGAKTDKISNGKGESYKVEVTSGDDEPIRYSFFWVPPYHDCSWKPDGREEATLTPIYVMYHPKYSWRNVKMLFLYGGVGLKILDDLVAYDPANRKWYSIPQRGEVPVYARYGHTMVAVGTKMLMFGGEKQFDGSLRVRQCFNDCHYFDTTTCDWQYLPTQGVRGELIPPRRSHVAVMLGKTMLVHGGISNRGGYHNDLWCLQLQNYTWVNLSNLLPKSDSCGLAYHTACAIFSREAKIFNIFQAQNIVPTSADLQAAKRRVQFGLTKSKIIKLPGVYFFGGLSADGQPCNTLRILQIGENPRWLIPEIRGKPPKARYQHTATHYYNLNVMIVFGGRCKDDAQYIPDIGVLSLETLTWSALSTYGTTPQGRCSHVAAVYETNLLVFGGINSDGLADSCMLSVELDAFEVSNLIKQERLGQLIPGSHEIQNWNRLQAMKAAEDTSFQDMKTPDNEEERVSPAHRKAESIPENLKFTNFVSYLPVPKPNSPERSSPLTKSISLGSPSAKQIDMAYKKASLRLGQRILARVGVPNKSSLQQSTLG